MPDEGECCEVEQYWYFCNNRRALLSNENLGLRSFTYDFLSSLPVAVLSFNSQRETQAAVHD